ncbi:MAG: TM0106 family RecB-like putative nuclease, partial [Deltaproteobacteria bacterium]|nr:TM0106 family RecB-like putative nuclease [Deltaproteobacteria bacterium]
GETVREQQKLLLTFGAFVLGQIQGHTPAIGVVVYSQYCKITTFRLARFESKVNDLLDGLRELTIDNVEPQLTLNRYCELCQFRDRCTNEATAKDDLSLLRSMSETEKKKNNRKGIFTVKQLSYTFRPRKRNKGGDVQRSPYYYSLQALAIRENKTYILNKPTIPTPRIQAYVDMEGNSNARSIYLIGLVVVEDVEASTYSFWADGAKDEEKIFLQLFDTLAKLKDVHLFHYGSYETRTLKRMLPLASKKGIADLVTKRSHNVLSSIYSYVYFPTYSNSLKEIGQYLGYVWTTPGSSGIQSVVWRKRWEITHDSTLKTTLIQYNLDDCLALRIVTDCVRAIANGKPPSGSDSALCDVALADEVQNASDYRQWGRQTFATDAFKIIADCAYFDYQRDKVYFRTNTKLKRAMREAQKKHRARQKPNKVVEYIGKKCTYCKGNDISRHPE